MTRVLLTGATGFVGSHVLRRLLKNEQVEVAVVLRPRSDLWRIQDAMNGVRRLVADLDDAATHQRALDDFGPDVVIHLAWDGVGNRFHDDERQARNIERTLGLLRTAHRAGARTFVGLGSQAEYGPCQGPVAEDYPTRPASLYGAAKLSTCRVAQRVCDLGGTRFAWLRLFSAYGPRDAPGCMVPYVIGALLRRERPRLTEGRQLWDYLYVGDAAEAICLVAQTPGASGIFNLGSGSVEPVRGVVERIRDQIDPSLPLEFGAVPYRPGQVMHLHSRIEKLRQATGWSPQVRLEEGIRRTVAWYRSVRNTAALEPATTQEPPAEVC